MSAILVARSSALPGSWRELSEALGAAEDVEALASATARWIQASVPDAVVVLSRCDGPSGLRVAWCSDVHERADWHRAPELRRAALETMRSTRLESPEGDDRSFAVFPLACRGEAVGVLEVLAATGRLEATWDVLEVAACQVGMALHGIEQQERLHRLESQRATADANPEANGDGVHDDDLDLAIAWTAHELRGPLVGLRAVLELLRERGRSEAEEALLGRCLVELGQMSGLVDDILRWGVRGEAPRRRPCDVVRIVQEALEQCQVVTGEGRVSLQAPPRAVACVEPVQLRGAVGNLVRNALMYAPAHEAVGVVVEVDAGSVIVRVRNEGSDIPPDEGEAIFLPFVRGKGNGGKFGQGLGLFITRRVAEANGGRLTHVSENGTTEFRLTIPRSGT